MHWVANLTQLGVLLLMTQTSSAQARPLATVESVDLTRYAGKWYEIARYPNRFERKCASDTTAVYTIRRDGKIQVVNACREKSGRIKSVRGVAKVVDKNSNAKLKVSFFWPFYGDYWIIALSPDYQYAVVGEPKRKYLWILSRTPVMSETTYTELLRRISELGYDAGQLQKTKHL